MHIKLRWNGPQNGADDTSCNLFGPKAQPVPLQRLPLSQFLSWPGLLGQGHVESKNVAERRRWRWGGKCVKTILCKCFSCSCFKCVCPADPAEEQKKKTWKKATGAPTSTAKDVAGFGCLHCVCSFGILFKMDYAACEKSTKTKRKQTHKEHLILLKNTSQKNMFNEITLNKHNKCNQNKITSFALFRYVNYLHL